MWGTKLRAVIIASLFVIAIGSLIQWQRTEKQEEYRMRFTQLVKRAEDDGLLDFRAEIVRETVGISDSAARKVESEVITELRNFGELPDFLK